MSVGQEDVIAPAAEVSPSSKTWNHATVGIFFCALSAVLYTCSNIIRRQLAAMGADPTWVACNQDTLAVVLLGPWLAWQWWRGRPTMPPWRIAGVVALVGLGVQVVGNQSTQWSMGVVGLSVTIPVTFAAILVAGALLGRAVLGEHPTARSWAALAVVIAAIVVLAMGAEQSRDGPTAVAEAGPGRVLLAVLASVAAGTIFACLSVTIRSTVNIAARGTAVMFLITLAAPLALGPISVARLGIDALVATPPQQFLWMAANGMANFLGFLAITKGLTLTPIVHASVLNTSQVAMAALAGLILFHEPLTGWLVVGIGLTIAGIMLIDRTRRP